MDRREDVRDFLVSRRARISPEQAGLPSYGRRRVPGLRREEVASLAGVSIDYYARLERGDLRGASDSILDALADALRLDEAERQHLNDLARAAGPTRRSSRPPKRPTGTVRPAVAGILAGMTTIPAYVRTAGLDIVAANELGAALFGPALAAESLPLNLARFVFLDPRSVALYLDWETIADDLASSLRIESGRSPYDQALNALIGELSARSDPFTQRWARHNVRIHTTATKRLHNPVIGDIELTGNALQLSADNLTMIVYTAEAGRQAEDQLRLLATWSATARRSTEPAGDQK